MTTPTETRGASHTPGPWRIGDAGFTVFGPPTDQPAPVTIAELPRITPRVGLDERKANARLIAAAPELLEALRLALAHIEENDADSVSHRYNHVTNAARAAIIKAKGQP